MSDSTITAAMLAEWRATTEAATPGEWRFQKRWECATTSHSYCEQLPECGMVIEASGHTLVMKAEDAAFIATARDAMPRLLAEVERLRAENATLKKGIQSVEDLIDETHGVDGLHLNGAFSRWNELRTGGRYEEWLIDFDAAMELCRERPKESLPQ